MSSLGGASDSSKVSEIGQHKGEESGAIDTTATTAEVRPEGEGVPSRKESIESVGNSVTEAGVQDMERLGHVSDNQQEAEDNTQEEPILPMNVMIHQQSMQPRVAELATASTVAAEARVPPPVSTAAPQGLPVQGVGPEATIPNKSVESTSAPSQQEVVLPPGGNPTQQTANQGHMSPRGMVPPHPAIPGHLQGRMSPRQSAPYSATPAMYQGRMSPRQAAPPTGRFSPRQASPGSHTPQSVTSPGRYSPRMSSPSSSQQPSRPSSASSQGRMSPRQSAGPTPPLQVISSPRQATQQTPPPQGSLSPRQGPVPSPQQAVVSPRQVIPPPSVGHHDRPPSVGHHDRPPSVGHHDRPPSVGHQDRPPSVGHHDRPHERQSPRPGSASSHSSMDRNSPRIAPPSPSQLPQCIAAHHPLVGQPRPNSPRTGQPVVSGHGQQGLIPLSRIAYSQQPRGAYPGSVPPGDPRHSVMMSHLTLGPRMPGMHSMDPRMPWPRGHLPGTPEAGHGGINELHQAFREQQQHLAASQHPGAPRPGHYPPQAYGQMQRVIRPQPPPHNKPPPVRPHPRLSQPPVRPPISLQQPLPTQQTTASPIVSSSEVHPHLSAVHDSAVPHQAISHPVVSQHTASPLPLSSSSTSFQPQLEKGLSTTTTPQEQMTVAIAATSAPTSSPSQCVSDSRLATQVQVSTPSEQTTVSAELKDRAPTFSETAVTSEAENVLVPTAVTAETDTVDKAESSS